MNTSDFEKIIGWLHSGLLTDEAKIKQSVIVPILRGLGWNDADPAEFAPEYTSGKGRVDYALLETPEHPMVFIEAKRLGGVDEGAEEQLFHYAYTRGVPLLVLTDGNVWNFYLSMERGVFAERRFYRAVLTTKEKSVEYLESFKRYLGKERVLSGEAKAAAEKLHTSDRAKQKARNAIPKVWRNLLEKPDPQLRDMLAVAVENECGTKPESDDLDDFLAKQLNPVHSFHPPAAPPADKTFAVKTSQIKRPAKQVKKIVGYELNGKEKMVGSGIRTLTEILKDLHRGKPDFMTRFASATAKPKTRLVAQRREELLDNQAYIHHSTDLGNGWWLYKNYSAQQIRKHIEIACKIADVNVTLIEE